MPAMNTPPSNPPVPSQRAAEDAQILAWLRLKRELGALHAKLEYLRLMVSLGVRR